MITGICLVSTEKNDAVSCKFSFCEFHTLHKGTKCIKIFKFQDDDYSTKEPSHE